MPDNGNALYWYSFDYGSVHFAIVSTEHNISKGSLQYKWLENDLAGVDRTKTPWLLVQGHRPMYNSKITIPTTTCLSTNGDVRRPAQICVDLAWYGHYHATTHMPCLPWQMHCTRTGTIIYHWQCGYNVDQSTLLNKTWSFLKTMITELGKSLWPTRLQCMLSTSGILMVLSQTTCGCTKMAQVLSSQAGCTCKEPWQG